MTSSCICGASPAGRVTSRPLGEDSYAAANVCDLPECIEEAKQWVTRMTFGKPAHYVPDGEKP